MPISKFSESTCASINWYVYALADESDKIFYVGKGIENRVFQHVDSVRKLSASEASLLPAAEDELPNAEQREPPLMSFKERRIRELLDRGIEPRMYIVWEGVEEGEALRIESVLISVLDWQFEGGLTNLVGGHGVGKHGLMTVEELEATRGMPFDLGTLALGEDPNEEAVAININRRWPEVVKRQSTLLQVSEGHWKLSLNRAKKCRYAIVHANRVVRGVFRTIDWRSSADYPNRLVFVAENGKAMPDEAFCNKNAAPLFGPAGAGSQNPIRYVRLQTQQAVATSHPIG